MPKRCKSAITLGSLNTDYPWRLSAEGRTGLRDMWRTGSYIVHIMAHICGNDDDDAITDYIRRGLGIDLITLDYIVFAQSPFTLCDMLHPNIPLLWHRHSPSSLLLVYLSCYQTLRIECCDSKTPKSSRSPPVSPTGGFLIKFKCK